MVEQTLKNPKEPCKGTLNFFGAQGPLYHRALIATLKKPFEGALLWALDPTTLDPKPHSNQACMYLERHGLVHRDLRPCNVQPGPWRKMGPSHPKAMMPE